MELTEKLSWHNLSQAERDERGRAFWRHVQLQTLVACENRLFPVEGIEAVLQNLQANKIPFCVASNGKHEKMAVTLVKTNLLHYVEGHVFSFEDVTRGKPAPDLFLHAAKTMELCAPPRKSLWLKDSLTGVIRRQSRRYARIGLLPTRERRSCKYAG
ncbi:MAG: HAD hydrolase-like protein [Rhizobium sp.]|nr:HAD hydrolase-like protein [Rhizobium sp.]